MRRYGIFMIGLVAAVLFIRLGFWQLNRLHQRRALRARIEQRERLDPLDPAMVTGAADSLSYRAARVRGTFDFAHQLVVTNRVVDEVTAVYIVTPLRYGDRAVLVERGWTPSADGYGAPLAALAEADTATVAGVLLRVPGDAGPDGEGWPLHVRRDAPASLGPHYPYPLFPLVLRRTRATAPSWTLCAPCWECLISGVLPGKFAASVPSGAMSFSQGSLWIPA